MGFNNVSTESQKVSIVLPCYNPARGWSDLILKRMQELRAVLPAYELEFILSNDGSTRLQTEEVNRITQEEGIIFLNHPVNEGKGSCIRKGAAYSHGEFIVYTDIDFPFGIDPIVQMVSLLHDNPGCQFVYGARTKSYFKQLPLKRKVISYGLKMLNSLLLSPKTKDTQAGIKALKREVLQDLLLTQTNSFVFEIEYMYKLMRKKVGIQSIPVQPEPNLVFTDFSSKTIWRELLNLVWIYAHRRGAAVQQPSIPTNHSSETYAGGYADF
ncbi:hypothetical protein BWI93_00670 [Siphonobacter sp. BAB-5385]|nr:hypothetical protein BWI93_00670 [Siphonobacter sp. BAB-5385]